MRSHGVLAGVQGLKDRGYTLQDNEAEQLVTHLDTDFTGQVDYLDWLAAMIDWHKVPSHPIPSPGQAMNNSSASTIEAQYGLHMTAMIGTSDQPC